MQGIGTLAVVAIITGVYYVVPANADDYNRIPASIRDQVREKCIERYPDIYLMQSDCVRIKFRGYLDTQQMPGTSTASKSGYYQNCAAARAAGAAPIRIGEPGYTPKLDRDGDGIACE